MMTSSRIFSLRSIDQLLAAGGRHQLRRLHITGVNATPSPLLSSEITGACLPHTITDLKTESRNRNVKVNGSKDELVEPLAGHDLSQKRTLTTAMASSRRPMAAESRPVDPPQSRHFNTTRALKSVNDSSTIDFAYMPQFELAPDEDSHQIRVPLLPDNYYPARKSAAHQEAVEPVMRPEISVMAGEDTHIAGPSAMSEVVDNHAMEIDPYNLTSKVHAAASKMIGFPVDNMKEPGMLRELWNGFLDDLTGATKVGKA